MKLAVPDLISNSYFPAIVATELGFFEEFYAGRVKFGKEIFELARRAEVVGEQLIDFVIQDKALLFACVHKLFDAAVLLVACHRYP